MLPKKERLKRQEFSRFFSVGTRINSPSLQLIYSPYPSLHASVVVSKKVAKGAVQRNRLRRRIYDMVRRYRSEEEASGVYIFIVKPAALNKTFSDLQNEVKASMERAATSTR